MSGYTWCCKECGTRNPMAYTVCQHCKVAPEKKEPQSLLPTDSELLIEFLEFWLEAGRLQDFDSRQEFRRHARKILLAMKGSK